MVKGVAEKTHSTHCGHEAEKEEKSQGQDGGFSGHTPSSSSYISPPKVHLAVDSLTVDIVFPWLSHFPKVPSLDMWVFGGTFWSEAIKIPVDVAFWIVTDFLSYFMKYGDV